MADKAVESKRKNAEWLQWLKDMTDGIFRKLVAIGVLYYFIDFIIDIGRKSFTSSTNKEVLLMILGVALNTVGMLLAFYFGSSQGSSDKAKQIEKIINGEEGGQHE